MIFLPFFPPNKYVSVHTDYRNKFMLIQILLLKKTPYICDQRPADHCWLREAVRVAVGVVMETADLVTNSTLCLVH